MARLLLLCLLEKSIPGSCSFRHKALNAGRLRPNVTLKATFYESLIGNVEDNARLLTCFKDDSPDHDVPRANPASKGKSGMPTSAQSGACLFPGVAAFITSLCTQVT